MAAVGYPLSAVGCLPSACDCAAARNADYKTHRREAALYILRRQPPPQPSAAQPLSNLRTLRTFGSGSRQPSRRRRVQCRHRHPRAVRPVKPKNPPAHRAGQSQEPFHRNPSTQPAAEGGPNLRRQARPFLFCGASRCHNPLNLEPRSGSPYPSKE